MKGFIQPSTRPDLTQDHFNVVVAMGEYAQIQTVAVTKNACSPRHSPLGVTQVPSNKLSPAMQIVLGGKTLWDQAINSIPPTWCEHEVAFMKTRVERFIKLPTKSHLT